MKINQPKPQKAQILSHLDQLNQLIHQLENKDKRPCPDCLKPCGCSGSISCRCDCNENCPFAASLLSSEADRYPIEPAVLPLVYAISDMRICQPCWSCEGHNLESSKDISHTPKLRRIPQVWFYSDSVVLLRLFDESLSLLKFKKLTYYDWQVSTTFSDSNCVDCAFALKPDLNQVEHPELSVLQKDILTISIKLPSQLLGAALEHKQRLHTALENLPSKVDTLNNV